jgi:predicted AlkP superfamily phosphohydrolase/phosphomutase
MKTLVIGLDAATWDVVDDLLDRDKLPTIASLVKAGVAGPLDSTRPPMTPLAWTSAATGVNPGKHGIYDFLDQDQSTYRIRPTSFSDLSTPAIWDVFDDRDRSIGIVNFPLASPPPAVDSFFVAGIPAPDPDALAHPPALQDRLVNSGYRVQPETTHEDGAEAYFEEIAELITRRCDLALELLSEHDVELLWTVFMGIDWVQHYLWNAEIEGENAVERLYRHVDSTVGRLVDPVEEDWRVLLLSDHGAGEIRGKIHLNTLLEQWDHLAAAEETPGVRQRTVDLAKQTMYAVGSRLPDAIRQAVKRQVADETLVDVREAAGIGQLDMHRRIDWERTDAFSYGYMGRVFLNLEDRYPSGQVSNTDAETLRQALVERFESATRPETDERLFARAIPGEEAYTGPETDRAPDILLEPTDWAYMVYGDFETPWLHEPRERIADHHPTGLYVLAGDGVRDIDDRLPASIVDIAPTLLYMHDLPLIEGMDGEVLDVFIEQFRNARDKQFLSATALGQRTVAESGRETDDVKNRLEDLGYL